jgi:phosphoesterase RecJ-like protein
MIPKTSLQKASDLIASSEHPLLICHVAPDGDAIGSLLGLGQALLQIGKRPLLACADPIPTQYHFLTGTEKVLRESDELFDLVITLDCSDLQRVGHFVQMPRFSVQPLLNIDHHVTNLNFGTVNIVSFEASSTAEIVLELLDYLQISVNTDLGISLLTGILTDTKGLRTSNVTVGVVEAVLRLMRTGASVPYIIHNTLDNRPTSAMKLWGLALAQLQLEDRVVWTSISQAMRETVRYTGNGDAGLANYLISAQDADAAVVFSELEDGHVEVSMRADPGFDVSQVALELGGGGHALASGCTIPSPLDAAQKQVLLLLKNSLERQRQINAGRNP